jgi:hypothetical protein
LTDDSSQKHLLIFPGSFSLSYQFSPRQSVPLVAFHTTNPEI